MAHSVTEPLSAVATEHTLLSSDEQVLMQTATVEVENLQKSRQVTTRLLLDPGSQRTYITNELAEKLQLRITGSETLTVYTFSASKPRELHTSVTELRLLAKDGSPLHLRVNAVPKITGNLQRAYFNPEKFSHLLTDIPLANSVPSTKETANIELLLGNDYCGYPCFRNFNSTIPVDVIRVKSYVNSFLHPTCVPVRISINKLDIIADRIVAGLVGVFRNVGGLGTGELYIPVVFFDALLHRSPCFPDVDFAALTGNPVDNTILFSRVDSVLWSH